MKKILLTLGIALTLMLSASAQKVPTKVIDNKGTIKWVLDSTTAIITKGDSTMLYVTPTQLGDSLSNYIQYADTAAMLAGYIKDGQNGITKTGQIVKLGGTLTEVTTINTSASNFLAITGLQAGSSTTDSLMVINPGNNQVKFISPASLFDALNFTNGLTKAGNTVKLGGALTEPITITTDATNVLKINGLQSGSTATDSIVVASSDGTLKKVTAETLLQSGEQSFTVASAGQSVYSVTNMPATVSKVWVYRNGVKLIGTTDYTTTAGTVTLTTSMVPLIAVNDLIEVQWVK